MVDDDPDLRRLLASLLVSRGHEIIEAADGLEGVDAAVREEPDLIILDIKMPGIDGYEVSRRLAPHRLWQGGPTFRQILYTALIFLAVIAWLMITDRMPGPIEILDWINHDLGGATRAVR